MATVSIQDIESVDDYWGPTFRAILEGNATEQVCFVVTNVGSTELVPSFYFVLRRL